MAARTHRLSIFSQTLDRSVFLAYLLGAIVPVAALGYVAQQFVLPEMQDTTAAISVVGLILSIVGLSLAAFLALRKTTHQTLARMQEQNRHLAILLESSRALAETAHRSDAARILASSSARLTDGKAAFLLVEEKQGEETELTVAAQAGDEAGSFWERHRSAVTDMARDTMRESRPFAGGDRIRPSVAVVPLALAKGNGAAIAVVGRGNGAGFGEEELDSLSTLATFATVSLHNADLKEAQRNFFTHLTDMLVGALDLHLDYHRGHAHRVAHIANRIGHAMGLDDERLERLHFASLLHDIGMLKIPRQQHDDKRFLRKHPTIGHRMLGSIRLWEDLAPFVLHHHEWYDGQGYPEGLAGEAIPLEARIIGLAEAVDSMTSHASYKEPVPPSEARRRVLEAAGTQFDPSVVRVFVDLLDRKVIDLEQLS